MRKLVVWHLAHEFHSGVSPSSVEFKDAIRYYEACVPDLGVRFRLEVERRCAAIVKDPLLWRERPAGHRRVNLRGFPYYIAFFIRGDILIVAAVAHASRDPDYWKQRDWS